MSGSRIFREIRAALLFCACAALGADALLAVDPGRGLGQYIVSRWNSRDAFPGGAINAIAQTPDGFLWIGAENGLVRFDGIGFRLIDHGNSPSLPPGPVLGLAVDPEGVLWVRMQSPYLMRYRGGRFEQIYPTVIPPPFTPESQGGATAVTRGTHGETLIATPGTPLRAVGGKFTPVAPAGSVRGIPTSVAETADGVVWVGMRDTGLFCVRDGRVSQIALSDQKVNVLQPAGGSKLWIGTDSGLMYWDGEAITRRGVPTALEHSPVLALAMDRDSNLWVSTPGGIARVDSKGVIARETGESPSQIAQRGHTVFPESTQGEVRAIFEDREGNIWLGGSKGLMQLRDAPFLSYNVAAEGGSLYIDPSGRTWVAPSSGGLMWIRGAEHHTVAIAGLDSDVIYSISGGAGELWVGRRRGGVTQLRLQDDAHEEPLAGRHAASGGPACSTNPATPSCVSGEEQTYTSRDGLAPGIVYAVHRGADGAVWVGTLSGGVSRIENGRVTTFTSANGLSGDAITTIEETRDGVVWVGTAGGLEAFRHGNWIKYGGDDGLPPGRVNSLAVDAGGTLWIGSAAGLCYWSGSHFEGARNIPESLQGEVYGLAADDYGNLWVATDSHVISISRDSLLGRSKDPAVVREFGVADGLPSTRGIRLDHSVAKDPSGRIWFSLQGGLCVVNPSHPTALAPASVTVESVTLDGRPLAMGPSVRYPSSGRRVVFSFIGVSLAMPGRVRYRYRLDGYDNDWSQPSDSREAAYTGLPPNRYTFRVMASNGEGLWNGAPASLRLEVAPQFYETWWFQVGVVCLAGAGIFAGFRYRLVRAHAAMNLRFEERLAERTRIARELHDTLLQSVQGLMLRLQVVDDMLPEGEAKEQLEQSLDRADQAIAEGRSALFDLRSTGATTNDLAQAVRTLGNELATNAVAFRLVVEGTPRDLHPIIRDELYRITREALRNAFRHAAAHHIEAEITYGERLMRLRIRDDGRGIPTGVLEDGRAGHYGLSGIRERAQQIGANLEIWSGAKAGTEIELSIAGSIAYSKSTNGFFFRFFRRKAG